MHRGNGASLPYAAVRASSMLHSRSSPDPASNRSGLPFWASFGAANAKADRICVAVQKTATLAWELDVIKRHGIERKLDLIIDNPRACIDRSGQGGAQGRLGRPHSLRLV